MSTLNESTRQKVIKRDNCICQYCGVRFADKMLHVDHIIPASMGGHSSLQNLVTACPKCNQDKSDDIDWTNPNTGMCSKHLLLERGFVLVKTSTLRKQAAGYRQLTRAVRELTAEMREIKALPPVPEEPPPPKSLWQRLFKGGR